MRVLRIQSDNRWNNCYETGKNKFCSEPFLNVHFSAKTITNLKNLNCPCCGIEMVTAEDFLSKLPSEELSGSSKRAIEAIAKFLPNLHDVEKSAFFILRDSSKLHPEESLSSLLRMELPKHLAKLSEKQLKIIGIVEQRASSMPDELKEKVLTITDSAKNTIMPGLKPNSSPFKRKTFIAQIEALQIEHPDDKDLEMVCNLANKLPNSTNDIHSFIVKYSRRRSAEIGQRLVSPSVSTIEHILPKSEEGENDIGNYLAECAHCNNERHSILLNVWIRMKPKMLKYLPINLHQVFGRIKNFKNKLYRDYPKLVVNTIQQETVGNAMLDESTSPELMKSFDELIMNLGKMVKQYEQSDK